jgi:hypothetical protein
MAQAFPETAHLKTDLKKFQDGWEHIFGKKEEETETEKQEDADTVSKKCE